MPRKYVLSYDAARYRRTKGPSWLLGEAQAKGFAGIQVSSSNTEALKEIREVPQLRSGISSIRQDKGAPRLDQDSNLRTMLDAMRKNKKFCVVQPFRMDVHRFAEKYNADVLLPLSARTFDAFDVFNSFNVLWEKTHKAGYAGWCLESATFGVDICNTEWWSELMSDPSRIKLVQLQVGSAFYHSPTESMDEIRRLQGLGENETPLRRLLKALFQADWKGQVVFEIEAASVASYLGKWWTAFMKPEELMKVYAKAMMEVHFTLSDEWSERAAVKA